MESLNQRFSYEPYHYNYIKTRRLWSIFGKTNQNKIIRRAFQDRPQGALCGADVCSLSITESEATFSCSRVDVLGNVRCCQSCITGAHDLNRFTYLGWSKKYRFNIKKYTKYHSFSIKKLLQIFQYFNL